MTEKMVKIWNIGLVLLLLAVIMLSVQQVYAKPEYDNALEKVYGDRSCTTCHIDSEGGKQLQEYGGKFNAQQNYKNDPEAALRAIGAPPVMKETQIIPTPTKTATITNTVPVETEKESSKEDKENEREGGQESNKKESPGFDILIVIGAISTIYMLRNKIRK